MKTISRCICALLLMLVYNPSIAQKHNAEWVPNDCPYEYLALFQYAPAAERYMFCLPFQYKDQMKFAAFQRGALENYIEVHEGISNEIIRADRTINYIYKAAPIKAHVPFDSLAKFGFDFADSTVEADAVASKGQQYFIDYYFNENGCSNRGQDAALLKHLQKWCIMARQDGETGCLLIRGQMRNLRFDNKQ
ncbi:hypothetical protein [Hymenobacter sp. B81]|uniref:hypothetical protein n=1 Tax=Hymenobacter sp. B81 TaxID=3344878 RepID=UPI0037DCE0F0